MTAVDQNNWINLFTLFGVGLICVFAVADINAVRDRLMATDPDAKKLGAFDLADKLTGGKKAFYGLAFLGVMATFFSFSPINLPSIKGLFVSKPSDSEIESQVAKVILADGKGNIFSVSDFERLNGYSNKENTYVAHIKYNLVFKVGLSDLTANVNNEANGGEAGEFLSAIAGSALRLKFGDFKAGDKAPKEEEVEFVNSDNGWTISNHYQPRF